MSIMGHPVIIENARSKLIQAFKEDEDFRQGYVANISMLLYDKYNMVDFTDFETRNRAAEDIMELIFGNRGGE
jgi:hypothetical protein